MIKIFQNLLVGFAISFIGSIPLGYLNVVGYQIYQKSNLENLIFYLLGVLIIEGFVIYGTMLFAKKLSENDRLLKTISLFSIFFMMVLAVVFYFQLNDGNPNSSQNIVLKYLPFLTGVILSSLNFVQIPFWIGWNLYLLNNKYITVDNYQKVFYVLGTLVGTFLGMLLFALALDYFGQQKKNVSNQFLNIGVPLFFAVMAVAQIFKYRKKYC
jgi:hypothetical protein